MINGIRGKRKIVILIIFFLLLISCKFLYYKNTSRKPKKENIEVLEIKDIEIFYSDNTINVHFGREDCVTCKKLDVLISQNNSELPKKIYYFDTQYWDEKGIADMICKKFSIETVPTILTIKNGQIVNKINLEDILDER